jgi:hypothetical protein
MNGIGTGKWKKARILTKWPEGLREYEGFVESSGQLGVHRDNMESGEDLYVIDHLATGHKVGWATETLQEAKSLAEALLPLGDWGDYESLVSAQGRMWELAIEADAIRVTESA